jgi:MFS superfamily sulfate permease-like transporter
MNDWIGLGILIAFAVGAFLFLRYLSKPQKITTEEFEKRAAEGTSLVGVGMMELQKFLDPSKENAIVATQELKQGRYNKKKDQGDGGESDGEENND